MSANQSIVRNVHRKVLSHPSKIALDDGSTAVAYAELWARVEAVAGWIAARTLPGDRVIIQRKPSVDFAAAYLGSQVAATVAVPVNPASTAAELDYVRSDSGAALIIDEATDIAGIEADGGLPPDRDQISRSTILYTSGTTSRPKGVVHTQASILANLDGVRQAWDWTERDHLVVAMPVYHTHGLLVGMTNSLLAGGTVTTLPGFDADAVLGALVERRATMFFGVPTMYAKLLNVPDPDRFDLSNMRLFVSGSAALPVELFEQFRVSFGHVILERYGMTETTMNLSNPLDGERLPGTVGFPLPGVEARLVSGEPAHDDPPRLVDAAEGEQGEIVIRGPSLFVDYLNKPDAYRKAFVDGWFLTGDVALKDATGRYSIVGRASTDIIKSRGFKIGALEIEDVIQKHPAVLEVAVIGVDHAEWGEAVLAVVAPKPGHTVHADEIKLFSRKLLAGYKCPLHVELVDEVPKTGPGKYKKRELIDTYRKRYL